MNEPESSFCDCCGEDVNTLVGYGDEYICEYCYEDIRYGRHEDQERHGWEQV